MTAGTPAPQAATVMGTPAPQAADVLGTPGPEVPGAEPRPGADDAAARVWRRMRELVLGRNERRREVCEALDLSFIRVKALLKLRPGPRTMRDLATELAIDRPYATVVIDELERRGLVARTVHPNDRRCRQVSLTAAGEDAAREADRILSDPPPALAALPPADLATLDRLTAALEPW
ncbi:MarR family transcriptional regulator [Frankia sp. AgB1.9]|uniref:MarR family winged helix-turn-helix transcriptional regulator n=1 Tax=unclassified Frankia TaxID=2632575 RepID=UPI001932E38E|nr:MULTISPECIES: MarR family transcriptional regulator [unclassified Frankia]MBL7490409.1 MarR family transcriptional regulator [Frankia sp. AgW1.1]MBL7550951.1 MarR family transcriptional regulator [Frankia sp. AgB1.9]MBL7625432.1 MarR family transcriptional regulator [Frankia sp. AgB1.8]